MLLGRGQDGLDEISTAAQTRVWVVTGNTVTPTTVDAAEFGLSRSGYSPSTRLGLGMACRGLASRASGDQRSLLASMNPYRWRLGTYTFTQ